MQQSPQPNRKPLPVCIYLLWLVSPWLHPCLPYLFLHYQDISSLPSDSKLGCPDRGTALWHHSSGCALQALSIFLLCYHCQWLVLSEKVIGTVGCSPMQRNAVSTVLEHFYSPLLPADNVTQCHCPGTPHVCSHFFNTAHESAGEFTRYHCRAAPGIQFLFHTGPV